MERRQDAVEDERTNWPYSSILLFGFFGARSPEGRRLVWRTTGALVVFVAASLGVRGLIMPEVPAPVWGLMLPLSVAAIVSANVDYVRSLDELEQALQLKAFAFAYGCVFVIAAALYGVSAAGAFAVPAVGWFGALVVAEPLRAAVLARLAREHE